MMRTVLITFSVLQFIACSHSADRNPQGGVPMKNECFKPALHELVAGDKVSFNRPVTFKTKKPKPGSTVTNNYFLDLEEGGSHVRFFATLVHPEIREIKKDDQLTITSIDGGIIMFKSAPPSNQDYVLNCNQIVSGSPSLMKHCFSGHFKLLFDVAERCENYKVTPVKEEKNSIPDAPVEI